LLHHDSYFLEEPRRSRYSGPRVFKMYVTLRPFNKHLTVTFKWRTRFLRNSLVMTVHQKKNPKEIES